MAGQSSPFGQNGWIGRPWLARPSKGHEATDFLGINSCSTCKKVPKNAKIVDVYFSCLKFVYSGPVQPKELRKKRFEYFHAQSPEIWLCEISLLLFKHPVDTYILILIYLFLLPNSIPNMDYEEPFFSWKNRTSKTHLCISASYW